MQGESFDSIYLTACVVAYYCYTASKIMLLLHRLLEKGFFHRAMKYEKRIDKKRRLKESAEKKPVKEDRAVTDFISS